MNTPFINQLHYGDNLERLRHHIPDGVADLIYLDPPFNSARSYNLLFKQHKGQDSPAQIMAFEDTWDWSPREYQRFREDKRNERLWKTVSALYDILGDTEIMAYVVMMAPRLIELHRKLKPTGSLFLHCDPVASHYLKIMLDVVFHADQFRNEVIWKRTTAHGDAKQGSKHFGRIHDTILRYTRTENSKWNPLFTPYEKEYIDTYYKYVDENGDRYWRDNLTAAKPGGDTKYGWRIKSKQGSNKWETDLTGEYSDPKPGITYKEVFPPSTRYWAYSREKMIEMASEGLIVYSSTGTPMFKRLLKNMKGRPVQDIWDDIRGLGGLGSNAKERRGYPTQKPLPLLERIIASSTDEGDVVLDPFAGCGTAIVAAERMNRHWIGIDITYLAINEIVDRLNEEKREGHPLIYTLEGTPKDEAAAIALFRSTEAQNHKPFEQWAVTLVGGRYNEKGGRDRGVDGRIGLWDLNGTYKEGLVQVKGGNAMTLSVVRDFGNVIESNNAVFGIMIGQREPTKEMLLVAEKMGVAKWPGQREIPRYQILTTQGILERGEKPIIPAAYRIAPEIGLGKAQTTSQHVLFEEDTDT